MNKTRVPSDSRPLVDRLIDRIRNNRVAAVLILLGMGLGGVASLSDSLRKVAELLPSVSKVTVTGEWKTIAPAEFYPAGPEYLRLTLQEAAAGQLLGTLQFSGNGDIRARRFDVLEGRRDGSRISLRLDSGAFVIQSGQQTTVLKESIIGEVDGDELRLVYQRDGHGGVAVTARPSPQADQLVEGRLALTFQGREYPDHRAACEAVLRSLDPPQTYERSEPVSESGNVHCVGRRADGRTDFDMLDAGIAHELICPPDSRRLAPELPYDTRLKRCECDGALRAVHGACTAAPR